MYDDAQNLLGVDPSTRTEVRELEPSAQVVGALDQDVFRLYVSMENSLPVHVIQRLQQLVHVASHQLLMTYSIVSHAIYRSYHTNVANMLL